MNPPPVCPGEQVCVSEEWCWGWGRRKDGGMWDGPEGDPGLATPQQELRVQGVQHLLFSSTAFRMCSSSSAVTSMSCGDGDNGSSWPLTPFVLISCSAELDWVQLSNWPHSPAMGRCTCVPCSYGQTPFLQGAQLRLRGLSRRRPGVQCPVQLFPSAPA